MIQSVSATEEQWNFVDQTIEEANTILHSYHAKVHDIASKSLKKPKYGKFDTFSQIMKYYESGKCLLLFEQKLNPNEIDSILKLKEIYPIVLSYVHDLCLKRSNIYHKKCVSFVDIDDLISESHIAVYRALVSFDPSNIGENKFITYCYRVINTQLTRYVKRMSKNSHSTLEDYSSFSIHTEFDRAIVIEEMRIVENMIGCSIEDLMEDAENAENLQIIDAEILQSKISPRTIKSIAENNGVSVNFVKKRSKVLMNWLFKKVAA